MLQPSAPNNDKLINSARSLLGRLADALDAKISVRLWDGTIVPLGENADPDLFVSISGPGVIGALLRWPTVENIVHALCTRSNSTSTAPI